MQKLLKLISLRQPTEVVAKAFIEEQGRLGVFEKSVSMEIGSGEETWKRAKECIENWEVLRAVGCVPVTPEEPPTEGQIVALLIPEFGLWFKTACIIRAVVDDENRYGFTYETLPGHVEFGSERFLVERESQTETVIYSVASTSRPNFWWLYPFNPIVRYLQKRFKHASIKRMIKWVEDGSID